MSAAPLRDEWLRHGLSTEPAERSTAEAAAAELYRRIGAPEPEFSWVPSPAVAALAATDAGIRLDPWRPWQHNERAPSGRIAALLSDSRIRMEKFLPPGWPTWPGEQSVQTARFQPPDAALGAGVGTEVILRVAVQDSLRTSLMDGAAAAIRTLLPDDARDTLGIAWYGQQEAHRVGYYDIVQRLGLADFRPVDRALLEIQAELTRSTGWWWSLDGLCVLSERPTMLHTEPTPNGRHNERRLHHADQPAVGFADGTGVYVLHGTIVPDWVVQDPTPERIAQERNIEVRRSAIERIGWDVYLDRAGVAPIGEADDPGNPGSSLRLYDAPGNWGSPSRLLLAVNGSIERDGTQRRYALNVPQWLDDPLAAAGWTYGLSGEQYAQLVRRT